MRKRWIGYIVALILASSTVHAEKPTLDQLAAAFSAKVLGSAVFVSGRDVDEALENSVYAFMRTSGFSPEDLTDIDVDRETGTVRVTIKDDTTRTAKFYGDQGMIIWPVGEEGIHFEPVEVESALPPADEAPWPMGDVLPDAPLPDHVDQQLVDAALDAAFDPGAHTAAFVAVHNGRIIAERYAEGADMHTPLESWSMGKSLTAMLYGALSHEAGDFDPYVPAPFEAWQGADDPRREIRIADLLRMSSGLDFTGAGDSPSEWEQPHPDHVYVYSGAINVYEFSLNQPLEHPPNTVGRYRNCDPLLIGYYVKQKVEARGGEFLSYPQRALFDKVGIRNIVLETDPYGNFISTGFDYGTARDWARLGMLMVNDGVWQGERILPEGFAEFVSTPAPAWNEPVYGGLFWLNQTGKWDVPESAYYMAGQGGQHVIIIPSHDLVVARLGHQSGAARAGRATNAALELLVEAVGAP